jgi:hypothetical protein
LPPTQPPAPTATPTLPPPSYNGCQDDPNPSAAPNYPIKITNINKVAESVTLQNVSTSAIDLTGWQMCSITSNQHHLISGILAAGASQTFVNTGGPIWNNSTADSGRSTIQRANSSATSIVDAACVILVEPDPIRLTAATLRGSAKRRRGERWTG